MSNFSILQPQHVYLSAIKTTFQEQLLLSA